MRIGTLVAAGALAIGLSSAAYADLTIAVPNGSEGDGLRAAAAGAVPAERGLPAAEP